MPNSKRSERKPAIRAARKAAQWRECLSRAFGLAAKTLRDPEDQARLWDHYEKEMEAGPDFARYHSRSDFRDAPRITLDRNGLARLRFLLAAIARNSWERREKGKQSGLVTRTTLAVFETLCAIAIKHGRVFPSLARIATLACCCRNTVIAALKTLTALGFVTVQRRLRRLSRPLGPRAVQDTNAYDIHEPNAWGRAAARIFAAASPRESNNWKAMDSSYLTNRHAASRDACGAIAPSGPRMQGPSAPASAPRPPHYRAALL